MRAEPTRACGVTDPTLKDRLAALQEAQRSMCERLDALDSQVAGVERDLVIIKTRLLGQFRIDAQYVAERLNLTPAYTRVAVALSEGSTVRNIVEATGLTENTVRNYCRKIYRQLNISSQTELVRLVLLLQYEKAVRSRPDAKPHEGGNRSPGC